MANACCLLPVHGLFTATLQYGTIDYGAVQAELAVRRSEAGDFLSIEGLQD